MTFVNRWLLKWSRLTHLCLSMLGLVLLLFFTLTGLMLNHEEWFHHYEATTRTVEGKMDTAIVHLGDRLTIVEALRNDFGAVGAVNSIDVADDQINVVFKGAGRKTEATIDRASGKVSVDFEICGILGRFADLHRGRNSGPTWSVVLDSTCLVILFMAVTGVVLWLPLRTRRELGWISLAFGIAISLVVYVWYVP